MLFIGVTAFTSYLLGALVAALLGLVGYRQQQKSRLPECHDPMAEYQRLERKVRRNAQIKSWFRQ